MKSSGGLRVGARGQPRAHFEIERWGEHRGGNGERGSGGLRSNQRRARGLSRQGLTSDLERALWYHAPLSQERRLCQKNPSRCRPRPTTRPAAAASASRLSSPTSNRRIPPTGASRCPPFGETAARLVIVGLAPGMHGANASGRPFTGDYAGILLYGTLHDYGFASQRGGHRARRRPAPDRLPHHQRREVPAAGEQAHAGAKCAPAIASSPRTCARCPAGGAILALGRIAHDAALRGARFEPARVRVRARRAASRSTAAGCSSTATTAAATTPTRDG